MAHYSVANFMTNYLFNYDYTELYKYFPRTVWVDDILGISIRNPILQGSSVTKMLFLCLLKYGNLSVCYAHNFVFEILNNPTGNLIISHH